MFSSSTVFALITIFCVFPAFRAPHNPLTVIHFVPTSHIDPGWLRTFDQNYGDVTAILRSVLLELLVGPNRTFTWEGTAYLSRFLAQREFDLPTPRAAYIDRGRRFRDLEVEPNQKMFEHHKVVIGISINISV